jgi:hypothetical protein
MAPEEYSTYFEKIFGDDKERQRRYLAGILAEDKATLSVGNRVLGAMLSSGFSRLAFTTNFDSIVEKAVAEVSGNSLSAYHIEGSRSAVQALNNEGFPFYCKLHRDFRYDSVKNLAADLATQNAELAQALKIAATRFGFIVAGVIGPCQLGGPTLARPGHGCQRTCDGCDPGLGLLMCSRQPGRTSAPTRPHRVQTAPALVLFRRPRAASGAIVVKVVDLDRA